jgi:amidase
VRITKPGPEEISELAREIGFLLVGDEAKAYARMVAGVIEAYEAVDEMADFKPEVRYPRTPGSVPDDADNPLNAWARRLELVGSGEGKLAGRSVAIKDNIAIAGVPMAAGTRFLSGHSPEADATIVTRILDAGARITGKANCEYLTLSGGSHTGWPRPVLNPCRPEYSAGGSSSGSAALIASGAADFSIGTDQGGSIRIPASWCGIVGLKPTYGLVPYTGIMSVEWTLDHAGPMTANVYDNALLLNVIAGPDGFDERQRGQPAPPDYTEGIERGVSGLRIGIVTEGFDTPISEAESDRVVLEAAERFRTLGATVEAISVPVHRAARTIWTPMFVEGLVDTVLTHNGAGSNHGGVFDSATISAMSQWRQHAEEFAPSMKIVALVARYMNKSPSGLFYGKAQNLLRLVKREYDRALASFDLLLMPTTPHKATLLPNADADDEAIWAASLGMNINTAPFCASGHPAISIPCGLVDGLPIGLMLVGRLGGEPTIYRAAYAFERSVEGCP